MPDQNSSQAVYPSRWMELLERNGSRAVVEDAESAIVAWYRQWEAPRSGYEPTDLGPVLGPSLARIAEKLGPYPGPDWPNYVDRLVRFYARPFLPGQTSFQFTSIPGKNPPLVSIAFEETCELCRWVQMVTAQFWGIRYLGETTVDVQRLAHANLSNFALALGSDLVRLANVYPRLQEKGATYLELSYERRAFEHLMLDVLNEHGIVARHAPLDEDHNEKTDLRVRYPWLERKNGARVQVTQSHDPAKVREKFAGVRRLEELIVLSPLSIAQYVQRSPELLQSMDRLAHDMEGMSIDWTERRLSRWLNKLFVRALERAPEHPFGPRAYVPEPVKQAVRDYVAAEAEATTSKLRKRLKAKKARYQVE